MDSVLIRDLRKLAGTLGKWGWSEVAVVRRAIRRIDHLEDLVYRNCDPAEAPTGTDERTILAIMRARSK